MRSRCSTARSPTESARTPGVCSGEASGGWRSAPAPPCSRRWRTSASSWSTRSTRPAIRTARPRGTTRATSPASGPGSRAPGSCSEAPRPRSRPWCSPSAGCGSLRLPERIGARPLPPVELVDLRVAAKVAGTGALAWSEALDAAVTARAGAEGTGPAAAQPAGLRGVPPVSRLRRGLAMPALQHLAHRPHLAARPPLPLLRA